MISIRGRLARTLGVGAGVILVVAGVLLDRTIRTELVRRQDAALLARAWSLANALQADDGVIEFEAMHGFVPSGDMRSPADANRHDEPLESALYYQVWHQDGRVAGRSANLGNSQLPHVEASLEASIHEDALLPEGVEGRIVAVRMKLLEEDAVQPDAEGTLERPRAPDAGAKAVEELTIVVAQDLREIRATMTRLRGGLLIVGLLALGMGGLLLNWALKRGLAPLHEVGERAAALDAESLGFGLGVAELPPELAPIRDRFDDLLSRLHASFVRERGALQNERDALERERSFNAAVAHELRTPIAELRTTVEVELLGSRSSADHAALRTVLDITKRMQALVEALLLLRRVESGPEVLPKGPCDAELVLDEVLGRHAARLRTRGLTLAREGTRSASIVTHTTLFASMIENVVSNAVDHAPRSTRITVRIVVERERTTIVVANPAPDLDAGDVAHLFEPFWRKDPSRTGSEHAGLGLSIAQAIARALDVSIEASLTPNHELQLVLGVRSNANPDSA